MDFRCDRCGKPLYRKIVLIPIGVLLVIAALILLILGWPWSLLGLVLWFIGVGFGWLDWHRTKCRDCEEQIRIEAKANAVAKRRKKDEDYRKSIDEKMACHPEFGDIIVEWRRRHSEDDLYPYPRESELEKIERALELRDAARYEEAAEKFESCRLFSQAGKARESMSRSVVKNITVNLNELLDTIGRRGLALPFKCTSCGATITVDRNSSEEGLKFCSYCGTAFDVKTLVDVLSDGLR